MDSTLDSQTDASPSQLEHPERSDAGNPVDMPKRNGASTSTQKTSSASMLDGGMAADGGKHTAVGGKAGSAAGGAGATHATGSSALQLGGQTVAKQDVIAFIHIGHSNMAGRGGAPAELRPYFFDQTDPHAWMYHVGSAPELAKEPFTAGDDAARMQNLGGPGVALVKQAVAMAPDKYFMSLGYGQSNAWCSQYLPGGLYYDAMMAAPKSIKDRVTFAAIVIMLGNTEHDSDGMAVPGYAECINTVVTAIRADIGQPDLPLLLCDYEREATGDYAVGKEIANRIIPEISKVPALVRNSVVVPTDGVTMQDNHHFDLNGHKVWSQRALDLMKQRGWFPWAK